MNKPLPIPGAGLCERNNIEKALKLASESSPAFSYVPPPQRWDALSPLTVAERSEVYSLVKASISPTKQKAPDSWHERQGFLSGRVARMKTTGEVCEIPIIEHDQPRERVPHGAPGAFCITEARAWADEFRIRTQVDPTTKQLPPDNTGPRISHYLSDRGLAALTDSAAYVSAVTDSGFTTFVTLTFSDESRARLDSGDTSIQREASRCFDAWAKMYQRGMAREGIPGNGNAETVKANYSGLGRSGRSYRGVKAAGPYSPINFKYDGQLQYLWVVEVPDNEAGEPNPHLHVLMRWAVDYEQFDGWASRLESAWGQGFAHLEKIKNKKSAGAYIAKAIGYLCKAQGKSDQGEVRGNRYGISASARAPGWELMTKTQIDCMGQLIADVFDHLTVKHGPDYQDRKRLNRIKQKQTEDAKAYKAKTGTKRVPDWMARQQKKINDKLDAVRERLNDLPVRCNRYQVILKSREAFVDFTAWATNPGFKAWVAPWLPEKPSGVAFDPGRDYKAEQGHFFKALRKRFQWAKMKRQALTIDQLFDIDDQHQRNKNHWPQLEDWACYSHFEQTA